jgi:hypothetical protein
VHVPPMCKLQHGADGEPLPEGEWVRRAFKKRHLTKSGEISELQFKPSSDDEKDPRHRLTVWVERLTTDEHVYALSNNNPTECVMARLNSDDVRKLRPDPIEPEVPYLEVEWHEDPRPNAEGHAGIRDLLVGDKMQRRSLRSQLANLAQNGRVT